MTERPNGNGRIWWRGSVLTGLAGAMLAWSSWVTLNVSNYVSGEARGERLSTTEAQLMIEKADVRLRIEADAKISVLEARIYEKIHSVEEQLKILNERLRLNELKRETMSH